jgi:hypothetical protein
MLAVIYALMPAISQLFSIIYTIAEDHHGVAKFNTYAQNISNYLCL